MPPISPFNGPFCMVTRRFRIEWMRASRRRKESPRVGSSRSYSIERIMIRGLRGLESMAFSVSSLWQRLHMVLRTCGLRWLGVDRWCRSCSSVDDVFNRVKIELDDEDVKRLSDWYSGTDFLQLSLVVL